MNYLSVGGRVFLTGGFYRSKMGFIQTYETDLNQSFIRFKKERKVFTEISNHKGVIRALNYLLTRDEEKKPYLLV